MLGNVDFWYIWAKSILKEWNIIIVWYSLYTYTGFFAQYRSTWMAIVYKPRSTGWSSSETFIPRSPWSQFYRDVSSTVCPILIGVSSQLMSLPLYDVLGKHWVSSCLRKTLSVMMPTGGVLGKYWVSWWIIVCNHVLVKTGCHHDLANS